VPKNYEGLLHPELKGPHGVHVIRTHKVIGAIIRNQRRVELVKKLKVPRGSPSHDYPSRPPRSDRLGEVLASLQSFATTR
jgi:hypothetical protein